MTEENEENKDSGQERDKKGHFIPKNQTVDNGRSTPTEGDYSKMNALLQKQTGMSAEKFVDYQRKLNPRELFNQLTFLADNVESQPNNQKQGLPPNQDFVPTSPGTDKVNLPGKAIGKQSMGKEGKFELHRAFDPEELFTPKKK